MITLLKRVLRNPWIDWNPHPITGRRGPSEKQTEFLLSTVEELLYGGAVRGGKTYGLMMTLVMYHDIPTLARAAFEAGVIVPEDIADVEAVTILDEVLGLAWPQYRLRGMCRPIRMDTLETRIDVATTLTGEERVPALVSRRSSRKPTRLSASTSRRTWYTSP